MRAPQPPQQLRAKQTRRQLMTAAGQVFAERGYLGASIDDVAEAADCSKGAYYFHFATKEDILLMLIDEWTKSRREQLIEAINRPQPATVTLGCLLEALFIHDAAHARLILEFWAQAERNPQVRRRLARAEQASRGFLIDALRRVEDAGALAPGRTPEGSADAALALQRGFIAQTALGRNGGPSARTRAEAATSFFVNEWQLQATA